MRQRIFPIFASFVTLASVAGVAQVHAQPRDYRGDANRLPPPMARGGDDGVSVSTREGAYDDAPTVLLQGGTEVEFDPKFVLDTGRVRPSPPSKERLRFTLHGEYQLRYRAAAELALQAPLRNTESEAGFLGQTQYVYHWLRLNPRLDYRDKLSLVGQIDVARGVVAGDTTQFVSADRDSMDELKWYEVHPRQLYLEYRSSIGLLRVGQQTSSWGMGILANDGDTPSMFGDYQRGALVQRILFATTPAGKGTPLTVVLAGDMVFEDNTADIIDDDDRAFQGVGALIYRTKPAELGAYGVIRNQRRDAESVDAFTPFTEELTVGVFDVAGKFHAAVPGADAFAYGAFEIATIFGDTSFVRTSFVAPVDAQATRDNEEILSFGASAKLGFAHLRSDGKNTWGDVVGEIEWGYASGDADPTDGKTRRFTMDQNHNVGLVLFDHVLRWKTARSATIAADPAIVNRPAPGLQFLSSKGGVFGASYLNPRAIIRPASNFDIKLGAVFAQTTSDFVDPYQFGAEGNFANYDGGDERNHDLGVELDAGFDARLGVNSGTIVQVGAEGGVLLPGGAFDDAAGNGLDNQYLANVKLGLQF